MSITPTRHAAGARTLRLCLEPLESRLAMSGIQPTAVEQLFLEQLNDIRANPAAYGQAIGLPAIANVAPAAPLALDAHLIQSAQGHSADMNANNYFGHYDLAGHDPGWRETNAGYAWHDFGESIAAGYSSSADTLKALIVDAGVSDLGHRLHLLAMNNADKSAGVGVTMNGSGTYVNYYTIDTGSTYDNRAFVTGVVFNDANGNGKYDVGEGLSGVTVSVAGVGAVAAFDTGGYSIPVNPGVYTVTASGGGLASPVTQTVAIGAANVRLNFTPGGSQSNAAPNNLLQIAGTITHSTEGFQHFVNAAYVTYLKRSPDAAGLNYWVNRMAQGLTDEQIEASFIGSAEYIRNHGGSPAWLNSMYQDLLGRKAQQSEIDHWVQALAQGMSANDVAFGFATSAEREGQRVGNTYQTVLGRKASADEVNYWVNRFQNGATSEDVAAGFLASQEFFKNQTQGNVVTWLQALYQDALFRSASSSELAYWETQMH